MSDRITLIHQDGAEFMQDAGQFSVAMCVGAAGVLGGFEQAAVALRETVPIGGHVVIGDLYRRDGVSLDTGDNPPGWLTKAFESATLLVDHLDGLLRQDLATVAVLPSSEQDWMTYSSLMWLSIEDWLDENHQDPVVVPERTYASDLLQHQLGWALIAGRRTRDLEPSP